MPRQLSFSPTITLNILIYRYTSSWKRGDGDHESICSNLCHCRFRQTLLVRRVAFSFSVVSMEARSATAMASNASASDDSSSLSSSVSVLSSSSFAVSIQRVEQFHQWLERTQASRVSDGHSQFIHIRLEFQESSRISSINVNMSRAKCLAELTNKSSLDGLLFLEKKLRYLNGHESVVAWFLRTW